MAAARAGREAVNSAWTQCTAQPGKMMEHHYRDGLKYGSHVLWIWGEKFAFSCLQQARERNFFTSFSQNLGFVDLPIPVLAERWREILSQAHCIAVPLIANPTWCGLILPPYSGKHSMLAFTNERGVWGKDPKWLWWNIEHALPHRELLLSSHENIFHYASPSEICWL